MEIEEEVGIRNSKRGENETDVVRFRRCHVYYRCRRVKADEAEIRNISPLGIEIEIYQEIRSARDCEFSHCTDIDTPY